MIQAEECNKHNQTSFESSCNQSSIVLCTSFMRFVNVESFATLKLLHRIITQGIHHERSRLLAVSLSLGKPRAKIRKERKRTEVSCETASSAGVSRLTTPALIAARGSTLVSAFALRLSLKDQRAKERLLAVWESCSSFSIPDWLILLFFWSLWITRQQELPNQRKHPSYDIKIPSWICAE